MMYIYLSNLFVNNLLGNMGGGHFFESPATPITSKDLELMLLHVFVIFQIIFESYQDKNNRSLSM